MNDERYTFVQDLKEKKVIARSAYKRRSHCGCGGAVKFPSDYLTKKEREAMNGECKTYRLNEPMQWHEFKSMPDDVKVTYIKLLKEKYGVPGQWIGKMLGVGQKTISAEVRRLGLSDGRTGAPVWDKEGFLKWWYGEALAVDDAEEQEEETEVCDAVEIIAPRLMSVPEEGSLVFDGPADASLDAIKRLLQNATVNLRVSWVMVDAESGAE